MLCSASSNSCLPCSLQHGFEFRIGVRNDLRSLFWSCPDEHQRFGAGDNASSTAYWMSGLSTIGSISFGLALVMVEIWCRVRNGKYGGLDGFIGHG